MTLSTAGAIATQSLGTISNQISVVSRNISGAGSPGVSAKTSIVATGLIGAADFLGVGRLANDALFRNLLSASAGQGSAAALSAALDQIDVALNLSDPAHSRSPASLITRLTSALQTLSATPDNETAAQLALANAQEVVTSLKDATTATQTLRRQADEGIAEAVAGVNSILTKFESVNREIVGGSASGVDVTDLLDQRDQLLTQLSQQIGVTTVTRPNNDGVALGARAARSYSLGDANETVQTILSTNKLVSLRLDSTQTALTSLKDSAKDIRGTLLSALNNGGDRAAIETQARVALGTFISTLNGGDGEAFLFAGINADVAPINDYFASPPAANKTALDSAFQTFFGFPQTSPAVAAITPAQMQTFLDGPMAALFSSPAWNTDWSNASDQPIRSQISISLRIESSVSANDPALQKLAMAYTMMSDLGASGMSASAFRTVLQNATQAIDTAAGTLTKTQARVGVMQRNVIVANETMTIQSNSMQLQLGDLEGVDPTEAATRVNGLMTQIETAYSLTAKITQLSLTRYL